ncbi:hypothetical protein BDF22DRAFT_259479 [Syncephalis plumigaleata]|nr:hypothetical protein BDF22DRAFT_259479 [Syncephalis plumigaleata]
MASFNPMIPNVALAVQPESVPLAKEPSQLMRFKNIHSMVTNEMARKSRHLSEVYTGVSVFPSSSTASSSSNSINGNASGNGNAELLEGLPSPPPPSPCLSPSSVHSLMETDSSLPTNHVMDCMSMPITPRTPMITNDDDVDNDNDDNGGLSQMTKELLSFWEEIEPATNTSDTLKLDYRLSLLLNNSRKDIHTSGGTAAAAAASILAMDNTMTNIWDDNHSNSNHEQEEEEEEELPRESESATDSNKLLDAFLAPDQDWFRNVNASRLALDGARPQSVLALTSHREHRYSDDVTTDLWSSTAPPPLVPITTTTSANAITPRRRASQVSSIRPITSYELTMPFNLKSPTILVTPNATTKLSTPPTSEKIKKSPSASSRFITWNAKSLIRKTKAEPRHTAPNSPNYTDILEESTDNKATDDMSKPPMLRGRSRSVSTTREMASMVSANRGQHHERAINKISEMFTSRKDTAAAAAAAAIAESSRLKPTNNNDSPVDVFSDGNGIIFKKKSMIKRIFTGRKHRQHPEGVSQHNNTNNNDSCK